MSLSDAKGGPLSVQIRQDGPYLDVSSCRHIHNNWADLVDTLYRKGYLLSRSHTNNYSLPLWVR